MNESGTRDHYARLAATYDENWAYSPAYLEWMTGCIQQQLDLTGTDLVADIGCGTGLYARRTGGVRAGGGLCRAVRADARPGPAAMTG